jgi:acetyl-CoA carboxylase biotin carboxyl carrier protein
VDLKKLQDVIEILEQRDIAEFELEEDGVRLKIKRALALPAEQVVVAPSRAQSVAPALAAPAVKESAPAEAAKAEDEGAVVVASPIVGTFYRAPDPNSPPFVNVGDHVRIGQVLCIIEAMKLMNEIEAETSGTIMKIHQQNGQPVQYGAPLFSVRPD